jgi:hypothetical protein
VVSVAWGWEMTVLLDEKDVLIVLGPPPLHGEIGVRVRVRVRSMASMHVAVEEYREVST